MGVWLPNRFEQLKRRAVGDDLRRGPPLPESSVEARFCGNTAAKNAENSDAQTTADCERALMKKETTKWKPGDVLIVDGRSVNDIPREGEILEVLGESAHPHFSVRWDNGRQSIFYPADDVTLRHPPIRK